MNTKIESLFLYESLDIIPKDFFSCSSFSLVKCDCKHVKYLNINTTYEIHLNNNTKIIPSFTFEHFLSLKEVQLPFNLEKKIQKLFIIAKIY